MGSRGGMIDSGTTSQSVDGVSSQTLRLVEAVLGATGGARRKPKSGEGPAARAQKVFYADPVAAAEAAALKRKEKGSVRPSLAKTMLEMLNGRIDSPERLAFEVDPSQSHTYDSVYKTKSRLLPDTILKRIAIQDDLVATIVNIRSAQLQSFGRPQPDRFSTGFKIIPDPAVIDKLDQQKRDFVERRIDRAEKLLVTCGRTDGWRPKDKLTFPQFLGMAARNAVVVGRIAVERIYVAGKDGEPEFHSFRPLDAGTIYKAVPQRSAADAVRSDALRLLAQLKDEQKLNVDERQFKDDEYAHVQVIEGTPRQAFHDQECVVRNFYPVLDVEMSGYPVTPLDTAIAAVTTHINITTHNRLYFQNGRAARGILVVRSDDVSPELVRAMRHQFQASINNANNSWRLPVFGVGREDEVEWQQIDVSARDMEFQYLSDTNARVIMGAFQISPEEVPGYQHLSRGTNSQALSESNNEYKLEAARDVGIRPLIAQFEDFVNAEIFPLIDPTLAKFCTVQFLGLDADTPEKEITSLQEAMGVHLTYDDVLEKVEKKPVGAEFGGQMPLNPMFLQILDRYLTVGEVLERFFGRKDASKDPTLAYRRDPFFFQWAEMQQAMQQQQAAAQQQAQGGQPPAQQGDGGQPQGERQQQQPDQGQEAQGPDLATGIDQVIGLMSKSEQELPPGRRRLLALHRRAVAAAVEDMQRDLGALEREMIEVAGRFIPRK